MTKTLQIDDRKITYYDFGDGPVIVFLHGFPLRSDMWLQMMELLKEEYRVIAPDLKGHGLSSAPMEEMYSMEGFGDDIHTLLEYLEVDTCHLVGHSMGGYVALAFAERYPDALKSLTLFHSTALADTPEGIQKRKDIIEAVQDNGVLQFADGMASKLFSKAFFDRDPKIVDEVKQWMAQTQSHSIIQSLMGMARRSDRNHVLEQLAIKTLFVIGEEDQLIPPSRTIDSYEKAHNGTIERLEGVGHMGMLEAPEASVRVLKDFFQK